MRPVLVIAILAQISSACGSSDGRSGSGAWTGTVDTLPSGQIVVTNSSAPLWAPGAEWQIIEEVRIGSADGDGPDSFGRIDSFEIDRDGRFWVLDGLAQEIRVFTSSGEYLRTIGRRGAGPGEFAQAVRIDRSPEGDLWVMDPMNQRLSIIDTTGAFRSGMHTAGGFVMRPWPGGFDQHDRYYVPVPPRPLSGNLVLGRYNTAFEAVDTIDVPSDPVVRESFQLRAPDGRTTAAASIPFGGGFLWRLTSRGTFWALNTDEYRLFEIGADGDTIRTVAREYIRVPVTAADREQARVDLKWFTELGGQVDFSKIPAVKPAVRGLIVDDEGRLWIEPTVAGEEEGRVLDVFDAVGRYLGAVRLPFTLSHHPLPIIRDDVLYAVTRDELDVSYLIRARILER